MSISAKVITEKWRNVTKHKSRSMICKSFQPYSWKSSEVLFVLDSSEWGLCWAKHILYSAAACWQYRNVSLFTVLKRIVMTLIALSEGSQGMPPLAKHPVALFKYTTVCEKHRKCTRAIHICEMRKKADFLNSEYSKGYRHASGKIHGHCFFCSIWNKGHFIWACKLHHDNGNPIQKERRGHI